MEIADSSPELFTISEATETFEDVIFDSRFGPSGVLDRLHADITTYREANPFMDGLTVHPNFGSSVLDLPLTQETVSRLVYLRAEMDSAVRSLNSTKEPLTARQTTEAYVRALSVISEVIYASSGVPVDAKLRRKIRHDIKSFFAVRRPSALS